MEPKTLLEKINNISFLTWLDDDGHTILNIPFWVVFAALLLLIFLRRGRRANHFWR